MSHLITYFLDRTVTQFIENKHSYYNILLLMSICILSRYQGAIWAGKILKDCGRDLSTSSTAQQYTILVIDENTTAKLPHADFKVILTDVNISSPHLLALSGVLSVFGQKQEIFVPKFLVQTIVSNALAILCLQTLHRSIKNQNQNRTSQDISFSIIQVLKYYGSFNISAKSNGLLNQSRGKNVLQGGTPFYSIYPCKTGYIAVGNLQPKFYEEMVKGLDLTEGERQFLNSSQFQFESHSKVRQLLSKTFLSKTAKEWEQHYRTYDTCVTQIRDPSKSGVIQPKITLLSPKL